MPTEPTTIDTPIKKKGLEISHQSYLDYASRERHYLNISLPKETTLATGRNGIIWLVTLRVLSEQSSVVVRGWSKVSGSRSAFFMNLPPEEALALAQSLIHAAHEVLENQRKQRNEQTEDRDRD